MGDARPRIGEMLLEAGFIDSLQLTRALGEQKQWGIRLGAALVKLGFVEEATLVRMLARQLRVPAVRLEGKTVDPEVLELIPADLARKYLCVPLFTKREGGFDVLYLGMDNPTDLAAIDDLCFRTGRRIRPVLVGPEEIRAALERFYESPEHPARGCSGSFAEAPLEPGDTAPVLTGLAEDPLSLGPEFGEPHEPEPPVAPAAAKSPARASASQPPAAPPAEGPEKPREVSTRTILRAVTELLIEKGVIGREELIEHIRARSGGSA